MSVEIDIGGVTEGDTRSSQFGQRIGMQRNPQHDSLMVSIWSVPSSGPG